jgi:uncharacterized protein (TIGR00296 family)
MASDLFQLSDGEKFVKLARKSLEYFFASSAVMRDIAPEKAYSEERGLFVTLHTFPGNELRGCIGYPEPVKPLWNALIECAYLAAFEDPRFPHLEKSELEHIIIEVSVLTRPEVIKVKNPEEYLKKIEIGRHGLIIRQGVRSGLLLPQVAPEWGWNVTQFLEQTCQKAGLPKDAWKADGVVLKSFEAQIFKEEKPKGRIIEENAKSH